MLQVFYAFFQGWRQRHGLPELELNTKQRQLVVLMIQSNLVLVNSAKDVGAGGVLKHVDVVTTCYNCY